MLSGGRKKKRRKEREKERKKERDFVRVGSDEQPGLPGGETRTRIHGRSSYSGTPTVSIL